MDVFKAVESRRSIRKYTGEPVPRELIDRLLEAARVAPSTSNTQSWKFKVVTDPRAREKIRDVAYGQKFVAEAPVIIACCLDFDAFKEKGKQTLKLVLRGAVRPSMEMVLRTARGSKDKGFSPERVVINGTINTLPSRPSTSCSPRAPQVSGPAGYAHSTPRRSRRSWTSRKGSRLSAF